MKTKPKGRNLQSIGIAFLLISLPLLLILSHTQQVLQQNAQMLRSNASLPTCIPRPPCLNANPRCEIAEPNEGWCPVVSQVITPTLPMGCRYIPVLCPQYCIAGHPCPPCSPKLVCTTPTISPSPTITPPLGCFYKANSQRCPLILCRTGKNCTCPPLLVCLTKIPKITHGNFSSSVSGNIWNYIVQVKNQWEKVFTK